jgi:predicted acylesterase/phospholipase RssA
LNLTGISGTSGGAISALLAWFGFLTGGPEAARTRLEQFWDANCAHQPGERLVNDLTQWFGNLLNIDLKFSPYLFPLRDIEAFANSTWPFMTKLWPPLSGWVRDRYFQLRESVAPHVDFELVAAIGDFCSIPLEIKRWHACELEARMFKAGAPGQAAIRNKQHAIEEDIRVRLGAARWIGHWGRMHSVPPDCLLRTAFDAWEDPSPAFDAASLDRLASAVQRVSHNIPQLLIGAVDIDSGAFIAFSSERAALDAGITLDAVVASASLPWVFMAQPIRGTDPETQDVRRTSCWDGLFSQNPPIKNFTSGLVDDSKKPDGLWILQINQDQFNFSERIASGGSALFGGELWHRRDTLSGNLSLNQEVAFIEAVNRRLDDPAHGGRPQDKPIEVARIIMDGDAVAAAAGRELGLFSKFDRDLALKGALLAHGREQAANFLSLRASADQLCDDLEQSLESMGAHPGHNRPYAWRPVRGRIFGGLLAPDVLTVDRVPGSSGPGQAALRWHVSDAVVDGRTVRIQGRTTLCTDGTSWRLGETRLLNVEEKAVEAARPVLEHETQSGVILTPGALKAGRGRAASRPGRGPAH